MVATYPIEEGREKKRAALLSVGSGFATGLASKTFLVVRTGTWVFFRKLCTRS